MRQSPTGCFCLQTWPMRPLVNLECELSARRQHTVEWVHQTEGPGACLDSNQPFITSEKPVFGVGRELNSKQKKAFLSITNTNTHTHRHTKCATAKAHDSRAGLFGRNKGITARKSPHSGSRMDLDPPGRSGEGEARLIVFCLQCSASPGSALQTRVSFATS